MLTDNQLRHVMRLLLTLVSMVVILCLVAMLSIFLFRVVFKPKTDIQSMRTHATTLVYQAGGPEKICREAALIFERFGTDRHRRLDSSELAPYPTIASLGKVQGIWPDNPAYISILCGHHLNSYDLIVYQTNKEPGKAKSPGEIEIVKGCIFAHR